MRTTRTTLFVSFLLSLVGSVFLLNLPVHAEAAWWTYAAPLLPPVPERGTHTAMLLPEEPQAPTQITTTFQPFYVPQTSTVGLAPVPLSPSYASLPALQSMGTPSIIGVSAHWVKHTSDQRIASALIALGHSPSGASSLETIQRLNGKVLFKDLSELDPQYGNYDALAWLDKQDNWMLFINEKHADAPAEALAALIAHEAMHSDVYNSKQEEAEAWQREARTWLEFQASHPELKSPSLNSFALVSRLNRLGEAVNDATLYDLVLQHPSYAHLPRVSPQFSNAQTVASTLPKLVDIRPEGLAPSSGLNAPAPLITPTRHNTTNTLVNILQQRRRFEDIPTVDLSNEPSLQVASSHEYPSTRPNESALARPAQSLQGIRLEAMPYRQQPMSAAASTFIWQTPMP